MSDSKLEKYFITGGHGLLGKAIVKVFANKNILAVAPSRAVLDLLDSKAVAQFVETEQPTRLIHLASKVYGLQGNLKNQFSSLSYNTQVNDNIFNAILNSSVKKVFFSGTVASYPFPYIALPLNEDDLFKGLPHKGEYGYATSKLHALHYLSILKENHGIDFVYGLLTNMFGPNDKFDTENGHVIPSLMRKAYIAQAEGKALEVWGRKDVTRDFLFIDDAAEAIIHLCDNGSGMYNIASGQETTMEQLAEEICKAAKILQPTIWQSDKPVGIPARTVDITKLRSTGFSHKNNLADNLKTTYEWYKNNTGSARHQ